MAQRVRHRADAIFNAELAVDAREGVAHGTRRDRENFRDLGIGLADREPDEDFRLPFGQAERNEIAGLQA
jgi:hypothetical protein